MAGAGDTLVDQFRAIASQRLERIETAWESLLKASDDKVAQTLHHELHTLKGEAQILGFGDVSLICHKLEDMISVASNKGYAIDDEFDMIVNVAIRFVDVLSRKRIGAQLGGVDLPAFVKQLDEVLRRAKRDDGGLTRTRGTTAEPMLALNDHQMLPATRQRLCLPAADAFIEYALAKGHRRNRLRLSWHALREVIGIHRAALGRDQLSKHVIGASAIARTVKKSVEVDLQLATIDVTSDILATVDLALLHLVRNAIDHGIESPAARESAGKPTTGRIRIAGAVVDGALQMTVADDGRGVDFDAVLARAIEIGIIESNADLPQDRWMEILWQPGFSTRNTATDLSGRGIGLDAVRASILALGGTLDATTERGRGTAWTFTIPLPRIAVKGIMCQPAGLPFPVLLEGWTVVQPASPPRPIDLAFFFGLPPAAGPGAPVVATFRRGTHEVSLATTGSPRETTARLVVATAPTDLYDVIMIDQREGLLLRPELLVAG
jgi:two-component system, chemotaxis family, sensor kinase CheA